MAVRQLPNQGWGHALGRLQAYKDSVLVAWVAQADADQRRLLGLTVRGGGAAQSVAAQIGVLNLDGWQLGTEQMPGHEAANWLRSGQLPLIGLSFPTPASGEGNLYWLTSGASFGFFPSLDTPSFYFSDEPVARRTFYYPQLRDAILERLYGRTRSAGLGNPLGQLELSLPYRQAYLGGIGYLDDQVC